MTNTQCMDAIRLYGGAWQREGTSHCCRDCTKIPAHSSQVGKHNDKCIYWLLKYELEGPCGIDLPN